VVTIIVSIWLTAGIALFFLIDHDRRMAQMDAEIADRKAEVKAMKAERNAYDSAAH
jgi:uncharacterized small protein (DUF1192 family)